MKTMNNWIEYIIDLAILVALFAVVKIGTILSLFASYLIPSYILISLQGFHDTAILLFQIIGAGALCLTLVYKLYKELKKKD